MTIEREATQRGVRPSRWWAPAPVDDPIQKAIGEKLKASLDTMIHEPVPERMARLLAKLEERDRPDADEAKS